MSEPRTLDDLMDELHDLCSCEVEDDPRHACIYCDAREQIRAQQRTIRLQTDTMTQQRALLHRIRNEGLSWAMSCPHDCAACDAMYDVIRGADISEVNK